MHPTSRKIYIKESITDDPIGFIEYHYRDLTSDIDNDLLLSIQKIYPESILEKSQNGHLTANAKLPIIKGHMNVYPVLLNFADKSKLALSPVLHLNFPIHAYVPYDKFSYTSFAFTYDTADPGKVMTFTSIAFL